MNKRRFLQVSSLATLSAVAPLSWSKSSSHMSFAEYRKLDALALAELIKKKEIAPGAVLDIAMHRAKEVNTKLNAITYWHEDYARKQLTEKVEGVFAGVPFLLKDLNTHLAGTKSSNGSKFFHDIQSNVDGTLVKRYKKAGLIFFGKTASPEFGGTPTTESVLWGATRNPWNLEHSTGGSSGGAAAAVAAGVLPVAHATDGGGSIRIPAACCGLFGLKPSRARVPLGPNSIEGWMGLSAPHVVSRTVRDSAAFLDISHGPEFGSRVQPKDFVSSFLKDISNTKNYRKLRIGWIDKNPLGLPVDPEVELAMQKTAKLCESIGHIVEPVRLPIDYQGFLGSFGFLTGAGMLSVVKAREKVLGRAFNSDDLEPLTIRAVEKAKQASSVDLYNARQQLDITGLQMDQFMVNYDLILSPVFSSLTPKLGELSLNQPFESFVKGAMAFASYSTLYNATGQPAMSVPLFWSQSGLPIGSMFAGRYGEEHILLRLARQLELSLPWINKYPNI